MKTNKMSRSAHDRREDGAGSVISSETSLAHAGAIVNDESGNIFVAHGE
jgi:hypothetical protein